MSTITDNFNRADADPLGSSSEGWSWTETNGDIDIVSNEAKGQASGVENRARADSDLGSADHYAQLTMLTISNGLGPCVRFASGADTCYGWLIDGGLNRVFKVVAGGLTSLASFSSPAVNSVVKLTVTGTTLEPFDDGVSLGTTTDSAISGNSRAGIWVDNADRIDTFSAGDLGGGATTHPENLLLLGVGG